MVQREVKPLKAVIFDFDGTVVETESVWCEVEREYVESRGGVFTQELLERLVGSGMVKTTTAMAEAIGEGAPAPEQIARDLVLNMLVALESNPAPLRPGIGALLREVQAAGLRCAIVSTAPRELIEASLRHLEVAPFEFIIASADVDEPKPNPEGYFMAMSRLGVRPCETIIIEDSIAGAMAGIHADAFTVFVPDKVDADIEGIGVRLETLDGVSLADLVAMRGDTPVSGVKTGMLAIGERVTLTDPKGRRHSIILEAGKVFHTTKGGISHDDLIGGPDGVVVKSAGGMELLAMRPIMSEFMVTMPRDAAVIYPKDAAQIIMWGDVFPGARVLEAGVGSGALSMALLRAIGPSGRLHSYERRDQFAAVARKNVTNFFGSDHPAWTLRVGDLVETITDEPIDRAILDMLAPWECVEAVAQRLVPGGILVCYVATTTQLGRTMDTIRAHGGFTEPQGFETTNRDWRAEGLAIRPAHSTSAHTGFLVITRRLAPGVRAPLRKRRPSPGAYGPDYTGPRPANIAREYGGSAQPPATSRPGSQVE